MNENTQLAEMEIADMDGVTLSAGFLRNSSDEDGSIRCFPSLKVIVPAGDEPPTIADLTDEQKADAQRMYDELEAKGDLEGFVIPTKVVHFKRGMLLMRHPDSGLPEVLGYNNGMAVYTQTGEITRDKVKTIAAPVAEAIFGEGTVTEIKVMLDRSEQLRALSIAVAVLHRLAGDKAVKDALKAGVEATEQ